MASRPVFVPIGIKPYVSIHHTNLTWNGGFAVSQKQKNVAALHEGFCRKNPGSKLLEISSASIVPEGVALSAFNLKRYLPELDRMVSLECIFQGGKVFTGGGPYTDLYAGTSMAAKKDPRLKNSGGLKSFYYNGVQYPLFPRTAFYDWLYIGALMENQTLADKLMEYDGFTDIAFNPEKGVNCQAKSAALYVALRKAGLLDSCKDFTTFAALIG